MKTRTENIIFYGTEYRRGKFFSQSFNWYDICLRWNVGITSYKNIVKSGEISVAISRGYIMSALRRSFGVGVF